MPKLLEGELEWILKREPWLTAEGFSWLEPDGHRPDDFYFQRERLIEGVDQIETATRWFALTDRSSGACRHDSRNLKHLVERYSRMKGEGATYVSNGALIAAAIFLGRRYRKVPGSAHAMIAIRSAGVRRLARLVAPPYVSKGELFYGEEM